jgi:hypothetical protein
MAVRSYLSLFNPTHYFKDAEVVPTVQWIATPPVHIR